MKVILQQRICRFSLRGAHKKSIHPSMRTSFACLYQWATTPIPHILYQVQHAYVRSCAPFFASVIPVPGSILKFKFENLFKKITLIRKAGMPMEFVSNPANYGYGTLLAAHATREIMLRLLQRRFLPHGARSLPRELLWAQLPASIGCTYRESSTFVSKHHVLQPNNVMSFLDQCGLQFKMFGKQVVVKECPFCHDTGGQADNLWKLYIGLDKGCVTTSFPPELVSQA